MKAAQVHQTLREITEQQWGLFTTAQTRARGVSAVDLQRARASGVTVPIRHGVHRMAGAPEDRLQPLRAEWLATRPALMAYERFGEEDPIVVSGAAATWVHEVGDLLPEPYEFTSATRHQSRSALVTFRRREVPEDQITVVDGLPVTTLEATVADLMSQGEDLSLVADVLDKAAAQTEFRLDTFRRLAEDADPRRATRVLELAGLDLDSQTQHLMHSPAGQALLVESVRAAQLMEPSQEPARKLL